MSNSHYLSDKKRHSRETSLSCKKNLIKCKVNYIMNKDINHHLNAIKSAVLSIFSLFNLTFCIAVRLRTPTQYRSYICVCGLIIYCKIWALHWNEICFCYDCFLLRHTSPLCACRPGWILFFPYAINNRT